MSSIIKIGIDFDNTIVEYDNLFFKCALEEKLITPETAKNKRVIRDQIRLLPKGEELWIILQSIVYGQRMSEAKIAEGFEDFLFWAKKNGHHVCIISHKTQYPALGKQVDLREAALKWMWEQRFFDSDGFTLDPDHDIFFETTRIDKLSRIAKERCNYFIDDLEEVFLETSFPVGVKRILFSRTAKKKTSIQTCSSWSEILNIFEDLK